MTSGTGSTASATRHSPTHRCSRWSLRRPSWWPETCTRRSAGRRSRAARRADSAQGGITLMQAAIGRHGVAEMGAEAERAAELLGDASPWRPMCGLLQGVAAQLAGRPDDARPRLEAAHLAAVQAPLLQAICLLSSLCSPWPRKTSSGQACSPAAPVPRSSAASSATPGGRARLRGVRRAAGTLGPDVRGARRPAPWAAPAGRDHRSEPLVRGPVPPRRRAGDAAPERADGRRRASHGSRQGRPARIRCPGAA